MMPSNEERASAEGNASIERELALSREANEQLVLSSLRALENTEAAEEVSHDLRLSERALRASEHALRLSEEELRTFADMMPLLAWYANPDGHIPWYNRRWLEYTGTTVDEQEGWNWASVHDPDDLPRVVAKWKAALASGEPWEDEFRLRSRDGVFRWFLSRATPQRDSAGTIVRWLGTNVDIDDQRRAEATNRRHVEAERERLDMMFAQAPAGVCVLRGADFRIELVNPLILDLWGKTKAVVGLPLMEALPELEGQGFDALLRGVLTSGVRYRGNDHLARLDRNRTGVLEDTYFDFVYVPLVAPDGGVEGVFVHAYDVTDKVVARRHAEAMREEALVASRVKDEFLATMSHELRTPLNAILGWASMLRRGGHDTLATQRALETIERNAKAQARLIEDMLDVSRIISGKLRLEMRAFDMNVIAQAAMDVVRPAAVAKGVTLSIALASDDGTLGFVGDADRLQQVLWNLLSNAVRFTPSGGDVSLHVERAGGAARIIVRDTGSGIPAEHLPFIFERFRQVDSSLTRRHGGLGLGLAIVRHLVELHGGSVTVESRGQGLGAVFTVSLPIRAVAEAEETTEAEPELQAQSEIETGSTASRRGSQRIVLLAGIEILLVEDDEDSRMLVQSALEGVGASVKSVASARAAVAYLEGHAVDVLVSDIGMPEEDGFSFLRRLRGLPASHGGAVPAIALTAYARDEDARQAHEAGFQCHLAKPTAIDVLVRTVAKLAQTHAKSR